MPFYTSPFITLSLLLIERRTRQGHISLLNISFLLFFYMKYNGSICVLVNLNGYAGTAKSPDVFALRPAPLAVSYMGFPGTMGSSELVDYLLADGVVIPPESRCYYSEKVSFKAPKYLARLIVIHCVRHYVRSLALHWALMWAYIQ